MREVMPASPASSGQPGGIIWQIGEPPDQHTNSIGNRWAETVLVDVRKFFGANCAAISRAELSRMEAKRANRWRTQAPSRRSRKHGARKEDEVGDVAIAIIEAAQILKQASSKNGAGLCESENAAAEHCRELARRGGAPGEKETSFEIHVIAMAVNQGRAGGVAQLQQTGVGMWIGDIIRIEKGHPFRVEILQAFIHRAIERAGRRVDRPDAPLPANPKRAVGRATVGNNHAQGAISLIQERAKRPIERCGAIERRHNDAERCRRGLKFCRDCCEIHDCTLKLSYNWPLRIAGRIAPAIFAVADPAGTPASHVAAKPIARKIDGAAESGDPWTK